MDTIRHILFIHLYQSTGPIVWKGTYQFSENDGLSVDCPDLPSDVFRAVFSGLRHDGAWGACMLEGGKYVTYVGRPA